MLCPQHWGQGRNAIVIRAWIWSPCRSIPGSGPDPATDQQMNPFPICDLQNDHITYDSLQL